jgi:hypothetical protein
MAEYSLSSRIDYQYRVIYRVRVLCYQVQIPENCTRVVLKLENKYQVQHLCQLLWRVGALRSALWILNNWLAAKVVLSCSGTHEKQVLEAGILEKLIDLVVEIAETDEENVQVEDLDVYFCKVILCCYQRSTITVLI